MCPRKHSHNKNTHTHTHSPNVPLTNDLLEGRIIENVAGHRHRAARSGPVRHCPAAAQLSAMRMCTQAEYKCGPGTDTLTHAYSCRSGPNITNLIKPGTGCMDFINGLACWLGLPPPSPTRNWAAHSDTHSHTYTHAGEYCKGILFGNLLQPSVTVYASRNMAELYLRPTVGHVSTHTRTHCRCRANGRYVCVCVRLYRSPSGILRTRTSHTSGTSATRSLYAVRRCR